MFAINLLSQASLLANYPINPWTDFDEMFRRQNRSQKIPEKKIYAKQHLQGSAFN